MRDWLFTLLYCYFAGLVAKRIVTLASAGGFTGFSRFLGTQQAQ